MRIRLKPDPTRGNDCHYSATKFRVTTSGEGSEGDLARYLQGNGPGAVQLGIYHVPVDLVLTNQ